MSSLLYWVWLWWIWVNIVSWIWCDKVMLVVRLIGIEFLFCVIFDCLGVSLGCWVSNGDVFILLNVWFRIIWWLVWGMCGNRFFIVVLVCLVMFFCFFGMGLGRFSWVLVLISWLFLRVLWVFFIIDFWKWWFIWLRWKFKVVENILFID